MLRQGHLSLAALLLTGLAPSDPPRVLKLHHLAERPDRLPLEVTLKKEFTLVTGEVIAKSTKVTVLEYDGMRVVVEVPQGPVFAVGPRECDLLLRANRAWKKLTLAQRAVEPQTLIDDASLWPDHVRCKVSFNLPDGEIIAAGVELELLRINSRDVELWSPKHSVKIACDLVETDAVRRARERILVEPEKRSSRIVTAIQGNRVDSRGRSAGDGDLAKASIFALYYGASWCGPCRKFSPGFVKFVKKVSRKHSELVVVHMSYDEKPKDMQRYMAGEKMPWSGIPLARLNESALLRSYVHGSIPQLAIIDRHGKLLADAYEDGRYVGPEHAVEVLKKLLEK